MTLRADVRFLAERFELKTVFFSYSHKDEALRDDLEIQLTMLKREGLIEAWHDRRIAVGKDFDDEISRKLEEADVILLLASPDFLASDYCWGKEVMRAMERHAARDALVIPVILRPCEWTRAPFGKLLAAPTDGKAVTGWSDRDAAFLDVARKVRAALGERPGRAVAAPSPAPAVGAAAAPRVAQARSSNLAIAKRFTQADEDAFVLNAFEVVAELFEGSLDALRERNADISVRFRRLDANRFMAAAYRDSRKEAACTIWIGGDVMTSGVKYVSNDSGATNTMNETLMLEKTDHGLFFSALMGAFHRSGETSRKLSAEQAAEYLWAIFLEPMQRR